MAYTKSIKIDEAVALNDFSSLVLDNSRSWIFIKDEKFRILYANKAFLEIYAPEQRDKVIGTTTIENFSEEEAQVFLKEDRKAMDTGYSEMVEDITDYKGKVHTIQSQKIRFTDKFGRTLMLGMCTDISKWAEKERMLAKTNMALENFAAIAAHDLRAPLSAIVSGINLIAFDKQSSLSDEVQTLLKTIRESAEGLASNISSILQAYKLTGAENFQPVELDFGLLLNEVKLNLANIIEESDAKILSMEVPPVHGDRGLLRQLLVNLIQNALKYRSTEKPIIILRYERSGESHLFSIEDNGIGVEEKSRDKIFELYKQTERGVDGFGIGLSLCKKIIEYHQGDIWVDPAYKPGCRICFTLPVDYQRVGFPIGE